MEIQVDLKNNDRNLAAVIRGTGSMIKAGNNQRIAFAEICETRRSLRTLYRRAALCFLIALVARRQRSNLDTQALSDKTDAGIADAGRRVLLVGAEPQRCSDTVILRHIVQPSINHGSEGIRFETPLPF